MSLAVISEEQGDIFLQNGPLYFLRSFEIRDMKVENDIILDIYSTPVSTRYFSFFSHQNQEVKHREALMN